MREREMREREMSTFRSLRSSSFYLLMMNSHSIGTLHIRGSFKVFSRTVSNISTSVSLLLSLSLYSPLALFTAS